MCTKPMIFSDCVQTMRRRCRFQDKCPGYNFSHVKQTVDVPIVLWMYGMSTKNVPQVKKEIGEVVGSIATGARLTAHRGTICARDNPTDPGAGCARCQSDSSRIVSDKAHEADCRRAVPQDVKGMVEQGRMQKRTIDRTVDVPVRITKIVDVPVAM